MSRLSLNFRTLVWMLILIDLILMALAWHAGMLPALAVTGVLNPGAQEAFTTQAFQTAISYDSPEGGMHSLSSGNLLFVAVVLLGNWLQTPSALATTGMLGLCFYLRSRWLKSCSTNSPGDAALVEARQPVTGQGSL